MSYQAIPVKSLEANRGQIEGLPANPRQWTREDLDRLKASITETPELLEARGTIVIPKGKKYIILGGNMRHEACKELGAETMPCFVLPADTPVEKLREIVVKDNGSFGAWDFDALANEWDDLPLADWGVPAWNNDDEQTEEKEKKDLSDNIGFAFKIEIECASEGEQEKLYNEFTERGYQCRILTL